jgi:phospholipid-translocating ATPase
MFDGFYQSLMCFFMPYLLFSVANFQTSTGLGIDDRPRIGVLVGTCAVLASNLYILLNTYRWDWLTVLINAFSNLLIFFWTGVYSSTIASAQFYHSGAQVYGALSFWTVLLVTVVLCLLPRFVINSIQKVFFPHDVDIIREQAVLGKFKYLNQYEAYVPPHIAKAVGSTTASDVSAVSAVSPDMAKPVAPQERRDPAISEEEQPFYPPSIAPTATTHNPRSQNGSNGTNYTDSVDLNGHRHHSWDHQPGLSMSRKRSSVNSNDFPAGGTLARVESMNVAPQSPHSPLRLPNDPPSHPV